MTSRNSGSILPPSMLSLARDTAYYGSSWLYRIGANFAEKIIGGNSSWPESSSSATNQLGNERTETFTSCQPKRASSYWQGGRVSQHSHDPTGSETRGIPVDGMSSTSISEHPAPQLRQEWNNRKIPRQPRASAQPSNSQNIHQKESFVNSTTSFSRTHQLEEETVDDDLTNNLLRGDQTDSGDPNYAIRADPWKFYTVGRVFKLLWVQPLGSNAGPEAANGFVEGSNERFHAKIQRFVVVKPKQRRWYSNCVQISTNGGRGAAKKGLKQNEHAIAYTSIEAPSPMPDEHITKEPIRVVPVNETEKLDEKSRINLEKIYPVEHNVKVCEVGMVAESDIRKLTAYYKNGLQNDINGKGD